MTRHLLIDTDPGIDDALAILLALSSPDARVEAITTVAGNVSVDLATVNARRILAVAAPDPMPPVFQGAPTPLKGALVTAAHVHGDDGLGHLDRFVEPDGRPRYPEPAVPLETAAAAEAILDTADRWGRDLTIVALGLADRLPSLVLGYLSITLPFSLWLMWAFLRSIPLEVEEAALIDGASRFQVFRLIVIPLAVPGIVATAIFSFIVAWNDYLIARIFINSITQLPLTVGVMHFFEGTHVDWGLMMAAAVLITLPLAVLFMFVQRQLVVGFGAGAVKG